MPRNTKRKALRHLAPHLPMELGEYNTLLLSTALQRRCVVHTCAVISAYMWARMRTHRTSVPGFERLGLAPGRAGARCGG
jgi:hypothetical protein